MSEQFATRRPMERHEKQRHAGRDGHEGVRQPTAAPTPADSANKTVPEDWIGSDPERCDVCPRSRATRRMTETAGEKSGPTAGEKSGPTAGEKSGPTAGEKSTANCRQELVLHRAG